ncbi:MAG TPA: hypothetical protein VGE84_07090 [Allosphingosinicella sp.]
MRKYWIAAAALAFAAPAIAEPYPDAPYPDHAYPDRAEDVAAGLPSPAEAEAMGHVMGGVADAMMDVDIGPLLDAMHPGGRSAVRGRTLGDIAGARDPHARERMHRSIGAMGNAMGAMATQAAILAPALERVLADFENRMAYATRGLPDRRDRDFDYEDEPGRDD